MFENKYKIILIICSDSYGYSKQLVYTLHVIDVTSWTSKILKNSNVNQIKCLHFEIVRVDGNKNRVTGIR